LDPHLALDLTSETFAKAFAARRRFRGSTEHEAGAWLFRIARNELFQYARSGKIERKVTQRLGLSVPTLSDDDVEVVERLASLAPLRDAVRAHFGDLPHAQREAVDLRVIQEMSYPDVASQLGVTEATARARVSRGLRELRERMTTRSGELSWVND
jgi:RNA polymerase sigma-70 factor (ECF subfamily)